MPCNNRRHSPKFLPISLRGHCLDARFVLLDLSFFICSLLVQSISVPVYHFFHHPSWSSWFVHIYTFAQLHFWPMAYEKFTCSSLKLYLCAQQRTRRASPVLPPVLLLRSQRLAWDHITYIHNLFTLVYHCGLSVWFSKYCVFSIAYWLDQSNLLFNWWNVSPSLLLFAWFTSLSKIPFYCLGPVSSINRCGIAWPSTILWKR